MQTYAVHEGQNLIDIAVELYGSAQFVVQLARDNNLSLDVELSGTTTLRYDEALTQAVPTTAYFRLQDRHIVTPDLDLDAMTEHNESEYAAPEHN